jgi:alkanesulfonate monooxygenase SsuD/methylene tetrahydromethanopterin reductase-like flavin-dependent oxidoreductase (luciferase family)
MIRFSIFSVLDYYDDDVCTIPTLYEQLLDQMVIADQLGFDAYWIGEHHGYINSQHALVCPNPAVLLNAAAQRTRRIGLNSAVANLSLRHPLLVAEDYALVDLLSQGRLGLGIGRGSFAHEYSAFGQSRQESAGRFAESWEIIQRLWRGETVTFQGRYYQLDQARMAVLPVQKPFPRYWFSAVREESFVALGRAARPVICLPHLTADSLQTLAKVIGTYRHQYLEAGGSDDQYELPLILFSCVAPTRAEAQQQGRSALQRYIVQQHHGAATHLDQIVQQLAARDQLWFGTPDDVIQLIERYQAHMETRHFVFWLDFGGMRSELVQQSIHLLAQEIIPHFRGSKS